MTTRVPAQSASWKDGWKLNSSLWRAVMPLKVMWSGVLWLTPRLATPVSEISLAKNSYAQSQGY